MRKFLLFICILAFSATTKAQVERSLYQQHADSLFQYLDKTPIYMGILYDRVAQFADLDTLSQIVTNNTNPAIKTSSIHFLQAWKELYDASYSQSNLMKPEWLDALITEKRDVTIVPIGVLNYRFNVLDSAAVQKNLIYMGDDSLLHDVAGRPQAPYYTREIFLASPLLEQIRPGSVTFQFPSPMLLQNNPVTVTSLYIDFGEGQTATLIPGGSATVQIQQSGLKTIALTANFSNGTQKIIRAILEVESQNGGTSSVMQQSMNGEIVLPCITKNMQANIAFADYTTSVNKKGEIEVGYYFANCNTQQLLKPIIILDGFDPGNIRDIIGIYDLLYYNSGSANFGEEMRQAGYDVMVVNFPNVIEGYISPFPGWTIPIFRDGGADYIERNAMAIVKLIDSVNQVLINNSSTEKLVIVGPSMGGLITRYALAYMEKNGMNHNTRLWASFDSPHWGANIPIGDQYWLEYYNRVAGNKGAKASLENKIGSVAARQMLLHHWSAQSVTPAPNSYRPQFMQNLQNNGVSGSNGFPKSLRKISLTNGSGYGSVQPEGTACGKILKLEAYIRNWVFVVFPIASGLVRHKVSESNIYFSSDYANTCKVFDGWYKIGRWGNRRNHYEERFVQTPSITKGYDRVPGGKFNTQEVIKTEGEKSTWLFNAVSNTKFSDVINDHSFIPTVSALSLTNHLTRDWSENLSTRNLVCSGETPFDNYFTPENNEDHVFLSASNVAWIKNEINNQQSTTLTGYYLIWSDSHNPGLQHPLYENNTPIWLPVNKNFQVTVHITNPEVSSISWARSGYPFSWSHNTNGKTLFFSGSSGSTNYSSRTVTFTSTVLNGCNAINNTFNFSIVAQGSFFNITASPNPATNDLTVSITDESPEVKSLSKNENVILQLYEFNTNLLVKQWNFKNTQKQFKLDVSGYKNGQYVLVIQKGNYKESKLIIIGQ